MFMQRAIELAKKGIGHVSPNPAVGAVLVKKGKIIGEGWHRKYGGPHAEVEAVKNARENVKGATLYVTLEPCCHFGKTPPCTDLVVSSGIKKVVIGMKDPFPKVHGKGFGILKKNKIEVEYLSKSSPDYKAIRTMMQSYIKWMTTGLPYITLKAGISLDGKVATRTGQSQWITSDRARKDARMERSLCDAVLVGSGTVLADDPELAPHGRFRNKNLLRVIIDPALELKTSLDVFRDENVFVACSNLASEKNREKFKKANIDFKSFGVKKVSLKKLLQHLGKKYVQHLYVEGGSGTHGYFVDDAYYDPLLVDRVLFYIAPKIIGGVDSLPAVGGRGFATLEKSLKLDNVETSMVGDDLKYMGVVNFY